jgi:mycoredoxin
VTDQEPTVPDPVPEPPSDPATEPPSGEVSDPSASGPAVVVHWRPGCGFCSSLLRGLERTGVPFERRDIWQDEDAAAFVRSVAGGNETVPTVRVVDVALVNPSVTDVLLEVRDRAPDLLAGDVEIPEPGRLARSVRRLLGG